MVYQACIWGAYLYAIFPRVTNLSTWTFVAPFSSFFIQLSKKYNFYSTPGEDHVDDLAERHNPSKTNTPLEDREAPALIHSPSLDDIQQRGALIHVNDDDNIGENIRRASSVVSSDSSVSTSSSSTVSSGGDSVIVRDVKKSPSKRIQFRRSTGDIRQLSYEEKRRMSEDFFTDVDFRLHSFKSTKAGMTQVWYNALLNKTSKIDVKSKYGVFMLTRM